MDRGGASFWIELEGWWEQLDQKQLVTFVGRDTILTYPGGENFGVSDALEHTFVREPSAPSTPGERIPSEALARPPRLENGLPGSYYVRLPKRLHELLWSKGPFYEWQDWQYPGLVRAAYEYTNSQVPSAVIGDFDGDKIADVAIHGSTGYVESKVMCIVSNGGDPRVISILSEPTSFDPPDNPATPARYREPRPTLYLKLIEARQPLETADGNGETRPTDAILMVRPTGEGTIYVYENGTFRTFVSKQLPAWLPTPRPPRGRR